MSAHVADLRTAVQTAPPVHRREMTELGSAGPLAERELACVEPGKRPAHVGRQLGNRLEGDMPAVGRHAQRFGEQLSAVRADVDILRIGAQQCGDQRFDGDLLVQQPARAAVERRDQLRALQSPGRRGDGAVHQAHLAPSGSSCAAAAPSGVAAGVRRASTGSHIP